MGIISCWFSSSDTCIWADCFRKCFFLLLAGVDLSPSSSKELLRFFALPFLLDLRGGALISLTSEELSSPLTEDISIFISRGRALTGSPFKQKEVHLKNGYIMCIFNFIQELRYKLVLLTDYFINQFNLAR